MLSLDASWFPLYIYGFLKFILRKSIETSHILFHFWFKLVIHIDAHKLWLPTPWVDCVQNTTINQLYAFCPGL